MLWGGAVRILMLHHVTYSINSLCHFFGHRRFNTDDHSRNLTWLAPFSFGEAWHNNHHAFPTSAFHGMARREFDVSGVVITGLERVGLIWDVQRIAPERQAAKALCAERCRSGRGVPCDDSRDGRARSPLASAPRAARNAAARRWMPTLAAGLSLGEYLRSVVRRIALLTAVLLLAIWAINGQGYFWPAWAWLGLGVLVLLDSTANWAWSQPAGAVRRVACVWTVVGTAALILVATWLLTWLLAGAHSFWPAWALVGLATAGSAYSLFALHDRVLVAHGRRALRARVDMLTRTRRQAVDAQASELRRIERDLHDGAQARLVALTLQLGRAELRVQDQPEVRGLILEAQREARHAITELRDLARGIVPPLLADRGLVAAVESLAARYGLGTEVQAQTHGLLAPAVESAAYFVVAEALTNTAKHASAERNWVRAAQRARGAGGGGGRRRRRRRRRGRLRPGRAASARGGTRREHARAQRAAARARS